MWTQGPPGWQASEQPPEDGGGRVTAGLSPRGPRGCPTPCRGGRASHTGRFWGVGPALMGEAEEREEGEEGCQGRCVREGPGPWHVGEGAGTRGWGGTSAPVCWGNWGHWARWGRPPLPAGGVTVSPSCVAKWAPSGRCSIRGATPGSPEMAPLPKCSSLVLPRASCCPPHPANPCLSHLPHPPQRPRHLCKCHLLLLLPPGQAPGLP